VFMQNHTTVFMNSIGPCGRSERIARVSHLNSNVVGLIGKLTERPKTQYAKILLSDLTFQSS
jgi:hypothetical protein